MKLRVDEGELIIVESRDYPLDGRRSWHGEARLQMHGPRCYIGSNESCKVPR